MKRSKELEFIIPEVKKDVRKWAFELERDDNDGKEDELLTKLKASVEELDGYLLERKKLQQNG